MFIAEMNADLGKDWGKMFQDIYLPLFRFYNSRGIDGGLGERYLEMETNIPLF